MAPPSARVLKAFRAMKDLGIAEEVTKPVLKNLLKVYDKNWVLIEEENYRALVDAIFETQDSEEAEKKKAGDHSGEILEEENQEQDESIRPLKRLRLKHQDHQASPSTINPSPNLGATGLKKPKVEADEVGKGQADPQSQMQLATGPQKSNCETVKTGTQSVPEQRITRSRSKQPVTSQSLTVQGKSVPLQTAPADESSPDVTKETQLTSISSPMRARARGKTPQSAQKENISISGRPSDGAQMKGPLVDVGSVLPPKQKISSNTAFIKPKDEPFTDDLPQCEVPITVILPDSLPQGNSSRGKTCTREADDEQPIVSHFADQNAHDDGIVVCPTENRITCKHAEVPDKSSEGVEIASTALGEVKISVSCNSAIGRPDFQMPSLDKVLQTVEAQCLRSYKSLDPSFSLRKLMKDMCECFLALGTSSNGSQKNVDVTPDIGLLGSSTALDSVLSSDGQVVPLNEPINIPCDAEMAISEVPSLPPPCSGVADIVQVDDVNKDQHVVSKGSEIDNLNHSNSQSIVVFKNQPSTDETKFVDDVYDIAKGHERVIIPYANEVNSECPPSFRYIPRNVVFQNAYVNFSLARIGESGCSACSDNCLLSLTPCACSHETGGDYAYTLEGLVKEELLEECISMNRDPKKHCLYYCKECPLERSKNDGILDACKGHLVRKFIKECWWKCGCSKQCGNRVVQRGISRKLQVFMTPGGKGWGLRTLEDLPKGAFVCEYVGEVLTNAELYDRVSSESPNKAHSYPVLLDADWGSERVLKDEEALCLDATHYGNVARFINHRCFDSTMVEIPVEVETPDHHYYHLAFFTSREVKALEELTWDYGIDFDDHEHPVKAFRCRCGSKFCRNIKRSSRSRSSGARK
ncbi:putative inactive histone-lysine N-methyltransferase SUVR2 isoform X1 [Apium graveolens]|uniref:putative inactive histone-lysine N-methyltransferase SUVR2 isoform X1 n=1 Tax=Apium graveolens TaxID=4045 RepID=UPI003D7AE227